ncbi:hypothetical protein BDZ89DRAFT_24936 [Hymenopellis radicata]|nr:hypothetical protein BDZ89DRAFT_24936 [Hymenopellis radicata]
MNRRASSYSSCSIAAIKFSDRNSASSSRRHSISWIRSWILAILCCSLPNVPAAVGHPKLRLLLKHILSLPPSCPHQYLTVLQSATSQHPAYPLHYVPPWSYCQS